MNILYIDTIAEKSTVELFHNKRSIAKIGWISGRCLGADLLPKIDQLLEQCNIMMNDLDAIIVNPGPGSFTGSRIGVVTANTIAWSLNIPSIASDNPQKSMEQLTSIKKYTTPVAVVYDRPASVTLKKEG